MDVGQLGEGVAHLVVDGALADFAALDVGDGNAQGQGNGGGGEHLVAVGDEQQQVGPPGGERVGQAEHGEADGLGHAGVGVGTEQALDARLDGEAVALDFLDRVAELRREMRAQGKDAQFDLGVRGQLAQRPVEVAVVGARGGDDADAALAAWGRNHRRSINWRGFGRGGEGKPTFVAMRGCCLLAYTEWFSGVLPGRFEPHWGRN